MLDFIKNFTFCGNDSYYIFLLFLIFDCYDTVGVQEKPLSF